MSIASCAYTSIGGTTRLKNKIVYMLNNWADAEDVMQDACVKVLEAQQASSIENAPAFFYRTANNIVIDRLRRRYRTKRIFVAEEENEDIKIQLSKISCQAPKQDAQLESSEALDAIFAEIQKLPPKCARAYLMNCAGDTTYAEIAAELNVTASMVEKYISRARRHLREACAAIRSELN